MVIFNGDHVDNSEILLLDFFCTTWTSHQKGYYPNLRVWPTQLVSCTEHGLWNQINCWLVISGVDLHFEVYFWLVGHDHTSGVRGVCYFIHFYSGRFWVLWQSPWQWLAIIHLHCMVLKTAIRNICSLGANVMWEEWRCKVSHLYWEAQPVGAPQVWTVLFSGLETITSDS